MDLKFDWIPEAIKSFFEGVGNLLHNDKFIGFMAIMMLAHYVSHLPQNLNQTVSQGILEWYKIALSGIFGAIMGYNVGKRL